MTTKDLPGLPGFEAAVEAAERDIEAVYCADLLSWAMGRAPENSAWCTVMGNVNVVAVASLADVATVVLCEGTALDEDAKTKAVQQSINIVKTQLPTFEAALAIAQKCGLYGLENS